MTNTTFEDAKQEFERQFMKLDLQTQQQRVATLSDRHYNLWKKFDLFSSYYDIAIADGLYIARKNNIKLDKPYLYNHGLSCFKTVVKKLIK